MVDERIAHQVELRQLRVVDFISERSDSGSSKASRSFQRLGVALRGVPRHGGPNGQQ